MLAREQLHRRFDGMICEQVSMSYLWIGPPLAWLCFDERSLLAPWAAFTIVTSFLLGTCLFDHGDAACRGV